MAEEIFDWVNMADAQFMLETITGMIDAGPGNVQVKNQTAAHVEIENPSTPVEDVLKDVMLHTGLVQSPVNHDDDNDNQQHRWIRKEHETPEGQHMSETSGVQRRWSTQDAIQSGKNFNNLCPNFPT